MLSTQHRADVSMAEIREGVIDEIIKPVLPANWIGPDTKFHINPTGRFEIGGPMGDAGLTGRKIIVDTYGGAARHGGGAFSGKDPSKVDRSAAYACRYVAKNIVAAGLAERCAGGGPGRCRCVRRQGQGTPAPRRRDGGNALCEYA